MAGLLALWLCRLPPAASADMPVAAAYSARGDWSLDEAATKERPIGNREYAARE